MNKKDYLGVALYTNVRLKLRKFSIRNWAKKVTLACAFFPRRRKREQRKKSDKKRQSKFEVQPYGTIAI